jgi:hypothetical protein
MLKQWSLGWEKFCLFGQAVFMIVMNVAYSFYCIPLYRFSYHP